MKATPWTRASSAALRGGGPRCPENQDPLRILKHLEHLVYPVIWMPRYAEASEAPLVMLLKGGFLLLEAEILVQTAEAKLLRGACCSSRPSSLRMAEESLKGLFGSVMFEDQSGCRPLVKPSTPLRGAPRGPRAWPLREFGRL